MVEPASFKYRAFISYSHADTTWARGLHRALETFHIDRDLSSRKRLHGREGSSCQPTFV